MTEPITIFRGDDTNFIGNKTIEITLDTDIDLSGIVAEFLLCGYKQEFDNTSVLSKRLEVVISHDVTKRFPLGKQLGTLLLKDTQGKTKHVDTQIPFMVTNRTGFPAFCGDEQFKVSYHTKVKWSNIIDTPTTLDGYGITDGATKDEIYKKVDERDGFAFNLQVIGLTAQDGISILNKNSDRDFCQLSIDINPNDNQYTDKNHWRLRYISPTTEDEQQENSIYLPNEKSGVIALLSDIPTVATLVNIIYPVGSIYTSVNATSPALLFGGTWERISGRFLLAATDNATNVGASQAAGHTGGEAVHTLTANEIPAHTHGESQLTGTWSTEGWNGVKGTGIISKTGSTYNRKSPGSGSLLGNTSFKVDASHEHDSVGGGEAHNNMPPFLAVYMWKRTA